MKLEIEEMLDEVFKEVRVSKQMGINIHVDVRELTEEMKHYSLEELRDAVHKVMDKLPKNGLIGFLIGDRIGEEMRKEKEGEDESWKTYR